MMLCLTGWQQKSDALAVIVPNALHFNYAAYDNADAMFRALPQEAELAVGWSLGGQLLVRAIAGGFLKAEKLILLSVPFQCVADEYFSHAMSAADFKNIRASYAGDPCMMVAQFQAIAGFGDKKVIRELSHGITIWDNGLFWLEELGRITCRWFDFSLLPETVIVHGTGDKVIDAAQAKEFAARIASTQCVLLPEMSHALHLQAPEQLRELVKSCLTNVA